jgi:hypothetical protein
VETSQPTPARDVERMMKLQDLILKAMARKITWIDAAGIAGMSVRNMQRMRARYQEGGYTGLESGSSQKPTRNGLAASWIGPGRSAQLPKCRRLPANVVSEGGWR